MKNKRLFFIALINFIAMGVNLLTFAILSNLVGAESFGIFQLILANLQILSILAIPGLLPATTQSTARGFEGTFRQNLKFSLFALSFFSIALLLGSNFFELSTILVVLDYIDIWILLLAIFLIFSLKQWVSFQNGKGRYLLTNSIQLISRILFLVCVTYSAYKNFVDIELILIFYIISFGLINIFGIFLSKVKNKKIEQGSLKFGITTTIAETPSLISNQIEKIFLGVSSLLGDLGLFALISSLADSAKRFMQSIITTKTPDLARGNFRQLFRKEMFSIYIFFLLLFVFLSFVIEPIINYFFPALDSKNYMFLIFLSLIFSIPTMSLLTYLKAKLSQTYILNIQISSAIFRTLLAMFLIPAYGFYGAVLGVVIYRLFQFICASIFTYLYILHHEK